MTDIGPRIAQLRAEKDLSQSALADKAETSQSAISQIENGDRTPSFQTLAAIAGALGVTLPELLGVTPADLSEREATHFRQLRSLSNEGRELLDNYLAFLVTTKAS